MLPFQSASATNHGSAPVGHHCIAEFWGAISLDNAGALRVALESACRAAQARLLDVFLHEFDAFGGVTGVAILAESHIAVHTWPEHAYAAIDIFMCGQADPEVALAELVRLLKPAHTTVQMLERGIR